MTQTNDGELNPKAPHSIKDLVKTGALIQLLSRSVALALSLTLFRWISIENFGVISIAMSIVLIAHLISSWGLVHAFARLGKDESSSLSTLFWLQSLLSLVVFLSVQILAIYFFADDPAQKDILFAVRIASVKILFNPVTNILNALAQLRHKLRVLALVTPLATLISSPVVLTLAVLKLPLWALITQCLLPDIVSAVITFRKVPWKPSLSFNAELAKNLFSRGSLLMLNQGSTIAFQRTSRILIFNYFGVTVVGYYDVIERILNQIFNIILSPIIKVIPALVIKGAKSTDMTNELKKSYFSLNMMQSFLLFPVLSVIVINPKLFFSVITAKDFSEYSMLIRILSLTIILTSIRTVSEIYVGILISGKEFVKKSLFTLFTGAILLALLLPRGIEEAGAAVLLNEIAWLLVYATFFRHQLRIDFWNGLFFSLPLILTSALNRILFPFLDQILNPFLPNKVFIEIGVDLVFAFGIYGAMFFIFWNNYWTKVLKVSNKRKFWV